MIYVPLGRKFSVRMDKIAGATVKAWWFNPRDGSAKPAGDFPNIGTREFMPPEPGEALDWVLVLDDAAKDFPPPGVIENWSEWLRIDHTEDERRQIRQHTFSGRPLAAPEFLLQLETLTGRVLRPRKPGRRPKQKDQANNALLFEK